ncbi:MAG: transglutaminase domain-containing protein [Oscillospiraceae bacterium]
MKTKRYTALMLLVFLLLTGCSSCGKDTTSDTDYGKDSAETDAPSENETAPSEPEADTPAESTTETPSEPESSAPSEPESTPPETDPGTPPQEEASETPPQENPAAPSDETPEASPPESDLITPSSTAQISAELLTSIEELRQPRVMDVSGVELSEYPEIDIINLYNALLSEHPELKYAYKFSPVIDGGILTCQISYMPYMTGEYPEDHQGVRITNIRDLIQAANDYLGESSCEICIENKSLTPDDMNRALQQAGGGYVMCELSRDATQIIYRAADYSMTLEECLSALNEAYALADKVIAKVLTADMSDREKATALYSYVAENTKYDFRYYSDRNNMPYASQTALGALRDGVAICGGYSHAVKLLFDKAGIPCFNVTGSYGAENHMWNIAYLDGQWYWCDATMDRGSNSEIGMSHFAMEELDTSKYRWNQEIVDVLISPDTAENE